MLCRTHFADNRTLSHPASETESTLTFVELWDEDEKEEVISLMMGVGGQIIGEDLPKQWNIILVILTKRVTEKAKPPRGR